MEIGTRIKEILREKKIAQKDVAQALGVGSSYISDVIRGKKVPLETLASICEYAGISLSDFFLPFSGDDSTVNKSPRLSALVSLLSNIEEAMQDGDYSLLSSVVEYIKSVRTEPVSTTIYPILPNPTKNKTHHYAPHTVRMPIMGEAAAGLPLFSSLEDETVFVPKRYADPDRFLAVRARGDSMEPKISSGDIVVAQRGLMPQAGQAALVCLAGMADDEYTIKRIYPEYDQLVLRSYNNAYQDMIYSPDDLRSCDAIVHVISSSTA